MIHYIIVRRDLPIGVVLAQVAHAAGESFYAFGQRSSVEAERRTFSSQVAGSIPAAGSILNSGVVSNNRTPSALPVGGSGGGRPSPGANFDASRTTAVVLGARNENRLRRLVRNLDADGIPYVAIREPNLPYSNALMAVGLWPGIRDVLFPYVKDFHIFPENGDGEV